MCYCQMVHVLRPSPLDLSILESWFGILDSLILWFRDLESWFCGSRSSVLVSAHSSLFLTLESWSLVLVLVFDSWLVLVLDSWFLNIEYRLVVETHCSWFLSLGSLILVFDSWF